MRSLARHDRAKTKQNTVATSDLGTRHPACIQAVQPALILTPRAALWYPEAVSAVQGARPLSSCPASLAVLLQQGKARLKRCLRAAVNGGGVSQLVERPAAFSRSERELRDEQQITWESR